MSDLTSSGVPLDPKEQMRLALEAKQKHAHAQHASQNEQSDAMGGPRGKAASKRQFRRKSGG